MDPGAMWGLVGSLLGAAVAGAATIVATRWALNTNEENRLKAAEQDRRRTLKGLQFALGLAVTDNNVTVAIRKLREFLLNNPDLLEQNKNLQEFYAKWLTEIDDLLWPASGYWCSLPAQQSRERKMKQDLPLLDL